MGDLIVLVPDHCLSFYFRIITLRDIYSLIRRLYS